MEFHFSKQAEKFWKIIQKQFSPSWNKIEEIAPDKMDLIMLNEIEKDPECHEFTNESEINWNE